MLKRGVTVMLILMGLLGSSLVVVSLARAQGATGGQAVVMTCSYRGQRLVVTQLDRSDADGGLGQAVGMDCAEVLARLVGSGFQVMPSCSGAGPGRTFSYTALQRTPLGPDELQVISTRAAACTCENALPVTGAKCKSCEVQANGLCACLFQFTTPP